ncbi:putative transcriptional regulator [Pseudonocardia sp. Ae406_Ps2]|uniref:BTAD domain-containing putative transcriptional regulator n=1 Tax=unclassified Pseudonocardia TaxID=2619320 RepID=UPI00095FFCB6|nr:MULTISPECIES: BTAD domain-containing putative transcriptional regulator [unclassified Pseudonocardia]OLL96546.1 putative transcriptional regulator [Pseudonocardia sp. Ae331_Ps2]OLM05746.1 putative transcriptional regulator [Pseudonocardia sp. Ae406_Ps2]OLM15096.1 putative transcriptional regulator [Pseudonocardia sp. Ae505_Ps2]OLM27322.1 putative transcriptional regulator [Pseudonocardia sp. Ae706_Ps2]
MQEVTVRVLGPLRVTADGTSVAVGSGRRRELLARLAAAGGEVVAVDTLVEDLWQGAPPAQAHGGLQVHVSRLRRLLEPDRSPRAVPTVLVSRPPGYALALGPDGLDARAFTDLLDRAAAATPDRADALLGEALALWAGPAYAEFADASWARAEAERLDELRQVALERRARARLRLGRADAVVPDLTTLVGEHPLREDAVGLLAVALYRTGRQADALAVLSRTRRLLADELGVDPGPGLRAIEADVLAHRDPAGGTDAPAVLPTARPPGPAPAEPPARTPSLLGRGPELGRLAAAAERARGGAQLVLVAADAGAGKSALLAAFAAAATADGWTAVTGRCPEIDGAPPAWAWREIVDALVTAHDPPADLVERLAPLRSPAGPGGAEVTFWLARAVVELLAVAGRERPLLLVLDDLHRAESETLALLRAVVTGAAELPVLVAAGLRPAEAGAELQAALAALAEPTVDRIEPAPMTTDDVAGMLDRHGVPAATPELVARITERTGGNPLFVRELARLVAAEGPSAAADAVPAGVREVLRRRVARLPASTRTALARVSVLGRELDTDDALDLAASADGDDPLDALEPAVLGGMLLEPEPGRLRFSHDLVRDTLYGDIPHLRRARLHAAAHAILSRRRPDDPVPLAHHALAAGSAVAPDRALAAVRAAAAAAAGFGSHREAARFHGHAVELAGRVGTGVDDELALRCALVAELARGGDGHTALTERRTAVERARVAAPQWLGAALTSYDTPVSWTIRPGQNIDAELIDLIETELAATPPDAVDRRVRLLAALVFEIEGHDDDRVRSASAEAMALTARGVDPLLRCRALNARFFAVLAPDLWHELAPVGEELAELGGRAGHAGYRTQAHHLQLMVAAGRHDLDAASRHAEAAVAGAPGGQLEFTLGWAHIFAALRSLVAGELDAAERGYAVLADRLGGSGQVNAALMGLLGRFAVRHAQGRLGELAPELDAVAPRLPPAFGDFLALAHLHAGDPVRAREVWVPDSELARSYYWLLWTCVRAEVAVGLGDRAVADQCRARLRPWTGSVAGLSSGTIATGPTDLVLAALEEMLDPAGGARVRHLHEAERVATELGAPVWRDRARRLLGRAAAQDVPNTSAQRLR